IVPRSSSELAQTINDKDKQRYCTGTVPGYLYFCIIINSSPYQLILPRNSSEFADCLTDGTLLETRVIPRHISTISIRTSNNIPLYERMATAGGRTVRNDEA